MEPGAACVGLPVAEACGLTEDQSRDPSFWEALPGGVFSPSLPSSHSSILSFGQTKQMLTEEKKRKEGVKKDSGRVTLGQSSGAGDVSEIKWGSQD